LFGENHPYGSFATVDDYNKLKREDLIEFHKENYLKGGFKIFISGKFGNNEFSVLNNYLGKLSTSKKIDANKRNWSLQPSSKFKHHIKKNNAVQNAIRMGFVGVDRNHKDYFGIKILSTILGGYFGSRLMTNIREDKGYTYGIGSSFNSLRKESIFFIATELKSEVVDLALEEIGKEISILQNELISDEELFTVKNYMQGSIQRSFDGSLAMLDRFKEINLNELDINYYHNYIDVIKNIDAENIKSLAQKYFDMDRMYILNVGN
jgi:predicted Zn-dependent peptidase